MPYKEWFRDEIAEICRQNESDERLAKHADSVVVWVTGLSILVLLGILYNFERIEQLVPRTYLQYSLFCLLISIVFALSFRVSLYFLLERMGLFYVKIIEHYRRMRSIPAEELVDKWDVEQAKFNDKKKVKNLRWWIASLRKLCIILAITAVSFFCLVILFLVLGTNKYLAQPRMVTQDESILQEKDTPQKQPIPQVLQTPPD